jgi:ATP-binding cassette subfamily F protein 3
VRPLVEARGLCKSFGPADVLDAAEFIVHEGDKIALVGPNGSGKSTVLKLLTGELKPDQGSIHVREDARVAYLPQIPDVPADRPVPQVLAAPTATARRLEAEAAELEAWMATPEAWEEPGAQERMARYAELQARLGEERSKGQAIDDPVLADLGVPPEVLEARFGDLSGGEKSKVLLARALGNAKDMDLLVLDEPTNHMDIPTIEWIEEYLLGLDAAVMLTAHDKYLLDNVALRVFEVDRRRVVAYEGNYSDFLAQKEAIRKAWEAKRRRDRAELQRQLHIIEELKRRNKFDSDISARRRQVVRMREATTEMAPSASKGFRLLFNPTKKSGRNVLRVENVSKSYGDRELFADVCLEIEKGDKIGVIGLNGAGKTTLLRILVGDETPDEGVVEQAQGTRVGYYSQHHETLDPDRTLYEEIRSLRDPPPPEDWTRGLLGRFGFSGETVRKKVETLSGGERARLAIAKFVAQEHNLLVLDEPTNHLDLASQEVVAQALESYEGSLVTVSHNRSFLDRVVNKVAVISHREVGVFVGRFSDAWTAAKVGQFLGVRTGGAYRVLRGFRDWEKGHSYVVGDRIDLTGAETQAFRRLLRWAEEEGRVEFLQEKTAARAS